MRLFKMISNYFLLKRIYKRMDQQKALSEKVKQQFIDINKAFDLKSAQFEKETKKLNDLRANAKNLTPEEFKTELSLICSPFNAGNEVEIDNLQKDMDATIIQMRLNDAVLTQLKAKL